MVLKKVSQLLLRERSPEDQVVRINIFSCYVSVATEIESCESLFKLDDKMLKFFTYLLWIAVNFSNELGQNELKNVRAVLQLWA